MIMDLKEHLGVTHQTARGIVQRMEIKGLIETKKSETDARYQCVMITEKGKEIGQKLVKNGVQTGNRLLHGMTPGTTAGLLRMLTAALKNVLPE